MRLSQFFLPLLIVLALYFLFLRPQRNRQRAAQQLANSITVGQRVVTTAGMYATVVEIDDKSVLLEVAPGVEVRYVRAAVSRVVEDEYAPALEADPELAEDEVAYADDADYDGEEQDGYALDGDEPTGDEQESADADTGRHGEPGLVDLTKGAHGEEPGATRYEATGHPTDAVDQARR